LNWYFPVWECVDQLKDNRMWDTSLLPQFFDQFRGQCSEKWATASKWHLVVNGYCCDSLSGLDLDGPFHASLRWPGPLSQKASATCLRRRTKLPILANIRAPNRQDNSPFGIPSFHTSWILSPLSNQAQAQYMTEKCYIIVHPRIGHSYLSPLTSHLCLRSLMAGRGDSRVYLVRNSQLTACIWQAPSY
jgi:hypothetical protein